MIVMEDLPASPGSYALLLSLPAPVCRQVGRLGTFNFPTGDYVYFGSASGPGGLRARVRHHARIASRPHWHLDWLRPDAVLQGGWFAPVPGPWECAWSKAASGMPGAVIPAPGFGAADCRQGCTAHLLMFPQHLEPGGFSLRLEAVSSVLAGRVMWFSL